MMKKLSLILIFGALVLGGYAQSDPPSWNLSGNARTTARDFFGTTDCNPFFFKTNNTMRLHLLEDKSFLGIGITNPQASLHLHYQTDPIVGNEPPNLFLKKLLKFTTPETGTGAANGFEVFFNNNDIYFKQYEQANFFLQGPWRINDRS